MPEDFLSLRRKQLADEGHPELADALGKAAEQPEQRRPDAMAFLRTLTKMIEALARLRQTGYRPTPDTLVTQIERMEGWSDVEIYDAVFELSAYPINERPAFYEALLFIIQDRGREQIMQSPWRQS